MSFAKLHGAARWGVAVAGLISGVRGLASNTTSLDGWNADCAVGSTAADPYPVRGLHGTDR